MSSRSTVEFTTSGQSSPSVHWHLFPQPGDSGSGPSKPQQRENVQRPDESSGELTSVPPIEDEPQEPSLKN